MFGSKTVQDALLPGVQELNSRLRELADSLDNAGSLDFTAGRVEIQEGALREAFQRAFGDEDGTRIAEEFIQMTRQGFLVAAAPDFQRPPVAFPWAMLTEPDLEPLLSSSTLTAAGIGPGRTPGVTRTDIQAWYPNAPDAVFGDDNLDRLNQLALFDFIDDVVDAVLGFLGSRVTIKPGGTPPSERPANPIDEVVACFNVAQFNVYWWGWEICLDNACADKLANVLLGAGGADLVKALKALLSSGAASATLAAIMSAAGGAVVFALSVIGVYLGLSIKLNNTPRGACIQGTWPTPLTGIFVWVRGR
jgi:hypothetical protein